MFRDAFLIVDRLRSNLSSVVLGKSDAVRSVVIALISGEHILLDDVPGVGKTLIARATARSIAATFKRIQFTPDLLPSDIVGSNLYRPDTHQFEFSHGPVFANVVLADEINRAPPRTQSALLEAMSEGRVSVDGTTYELPQPFTVVATQNPIEFEGTYRLPESQLDRFLLRTRVGYPQRDVERSVLQSHRLTEPVAGLEPVATDAEIVSTQQAVRKVRVEDSVVDYLLSIVEATRNSSELDLGVSTRAALSFYRGCQGRAITEHRDFVIPEDVKSLAVSVLSHRVIPRGAHQFSDMSTTDQIIQDILDSTPVPV